MKRSCALLLPVILSLLLSACGGLNGQAGRSPNSRNLTAGGGVDAPVQITGFQPAPGNVSSMPTRIQVSFSSGNIEQTGLASISSYRISCSGGSPLAVQGVNYVPGLSSVSVDLPTISGLGAGSICSFSVSVDLRDGNGHFVAGEHSAIYTLTANVAGSGSTLWQPSASTTYSAAVGRAPGSEFLAVGAAGTVLAGLMLNGTRYVDGISGVWTAGFNGSQRSYGQSHGATAGGFTELACPAGYRLSGIYGRAGDYVDSLGIDCKSEDYARSWRSGRMGGEGGTDYQLSCPAGRFVTDIGGRENGSYLTQLFIGCR